MAGPKTHRQKRRKRKKGDLKKTRRVRNPPEEEEEEEGGGGGGEGGRNFLSSSCLTPYYHTIPNIYIYIYFFFFLFWYRGKKKRWEKGIRRYLKSKRFHKKVRILGTQCVILSSTHVVNYVTLLSLTDQYKKLQNPCVL